MTEQPNLANPAGGLPWAIFVTKMEITERAKFERRLHTMRKSTERQPSLVKIYRQFLASEQSATFVAKVSEQYTQGSLIRMLENGDRSGRRAAALALGMIGNFESNAILGKALNDADRGVRMLAEQGIQQVWTRQASGVWQQQLQVIIRLNHASRYQQARRRASRLKAEAKGYAEAVHQRAVARFGLHDFRGAIADARRTLDLNPYHFAAATLLGHSYIECDNPIIALDCFERALKLNPNLLRVRSHVDFLQRLLKQK